MKIKSKGLKNLVWFLAMAFFVTLIGTADVMAKEKKDKERKKKSRGVSIKRILKLESLTEEQRTALKKIKESDKAKKIEKMREEMKALYAEMSKEAMKILTDKQKKELEEMKGKKKAKGADKEKEK